MTKLRIALLTASIAAPLNIAVAAEISGTVTEDGTKAKLEGVLVSLYRFDGNTQFWSLVGSRTTGTKDTGTAGEYLFTLPVSSSVPTEGSYIVTFPGSPVLFQSDPYYQFGTYSFSGNRFNYSETYNDVNHNNPNKPPTVFNIAKATDKKVANASLEQFPGCFVVDAITVNGQPYLNFFSSGPTLSPAGGALNITFNVLNQTGKTVKQDVQAVAYAKRWSTTLTGARTAMLLAKKTAVTLKPGRNIVKLDPVTVPKALMQSTLPTPTPSFPTWAFNIGLEGIGTDGISNCYDQPVIAVRHTGTSGRPADAELAVTESARPGPGLIPTKLSPDLKPLAWGLPKLQAD